MSTHIYVYKLLGPSFAQIIISIDQDNCPSGRPMATSYNVMGDFCDCYRNESKKLQDTLVDLQITFKRIVIVHNAIGHCCTRSAAGRCDF